MTKFSTYFYQIPFQNESVIAESSPDPISMDGHRPQFYSLMPDQHHVRSLALPNIRIREDISYVLVLSVIIIPLVTDIICGIHPHY